MKGISARTSPMTSEQTYMWAAKNLAELVARRSQVKALRKIAKALYWACKNAGPPSYGEMRQAINLYEKEMR